MRRPNADHGNLRTIFGTRRRTKNASEFLSADFRGRPRTTITLYSLGGTPFPRTATDARPAVIELHVSRETSPNDSPLYSPQNSPVLGTSSIPLYTSRYYMDRGWQAGNRVFGIRACSSTVRAGDS